MASGKPSQMAAQSEGVTSTSRSLLVRLRNDDSEAWDRLVTLYAPLVYFWCRKLGLANHDAPDVVQDVFRSVATGIENFRKESPADTFRGWLRTITRCKAADHYRRQSRQPAAAGGSEALRRMQEYPDAHSLHTLSDEPYLQADEASVYHGLFLRACDLIRTDFKDHTWRAFWRVVVDGVLPKEVADELSMQPGAVRVAKSRVLQRLREEMGELPE